MISAVLFDLDETLLNRTETVTAFLADQHERFSASLGHVSLQTWRERFLVLDQRGHVHKSIVYPTILSEFGGDAALAPILLEDYRERCCQYALSFPGMRETLTALRAHGLKLGVVTNGEIAVQSRNSEALGLHLMTDAILISEKEGLRKPDRALFIRAAEKLEIPPSSCLFVGDNPVVDVIGAHEAGMKTAWFGRQGEWPANLANPGASITELGEILKLLGLEKQASNID